MKEKFNSIKNKKSVIVGAILLLLLLVGGATFAYLSSQTGEGAEANMRVTTATTELLTFKTGGDLNISASLENFAENAGNLEKTTTATAILSAASTGAIATHNYYVYVDISENDFEYTTDTRTPELILTITDPTGSPVTTLDGLQYVTVGDVSGFDLTRQKGLIPVAEKYEISTSTTKTDTWEFKLTFVNLDSNQLGNTGKTLNSKIIIQQEESQNAIALKVEEQLNKMTLDEKIAQLTIISFNGNTFSTALQNELALKPGGVIFFAGNINGYTNTTNLISQIQATADIPMFVSIDQEGGRVQRITNAVDSRVQTIPYMRTVGNKNDPKLTYQLGKVIAEEVLAFGFNMDFAPVIDVVPAGSTNVIGNRSFSGDPDIVSKLGVEIYNGILDTGVIPSYKHFPGHGATDTDSHYSLPVLNQTKDELMATHIAPFKYAIDHGAELIMVGHLAIPNIDSEGYPASLSSVIINDLLKTELGFNGLVITDSLQMKAIADNYPESTRYALALNSGVDILLMPSSCANALSALKKNVADGVVTEERINESVRKILKLKYTKLKSEKLPESYLGSEEHINVVSQFSE